MHVIQARGFIANVGMPVCRKHRTQVKCVTCNLPGYSCHGILTDRQTQREPPAQTPALFEPAQLLELKVIRTIENALSWTWLDLRTLVPLRGVTSVTITLET